MKRSHGVRPRSIRTSLQDRKSKYGGGSSSSSSSGSSLPNVLVMLMISIGSFFAGTLVSWQTTTTQQQQQQHACPTQAEMDEMISQRVQNGTFVHSKG
jgi:cytochrome c-type biogenesis protein CcmH/NrfG